MLGMVFAMCNCEEQAQFLNEAGRSLRRACHVIEGGEDMQCCRIFEHLDSDGKRLIKRLASYIASDESK